MSCKKCGTLAVDPIGHQGMVAVELLDTFLMNSPGRSATGRLSKECMAVNLVPFPSDVEGRSQGPEWLYSAHVQP